MTYIAELQFLTEGQAKCPSPTPDLEIELKQSNKQVRVILVIWGHKQFMVFWIGTICNLIEVNVQRMQSSKFLYFKKKLLTFSNYLIFFQLFCSAPNFFKNYSQLFRQN